MGKSLEKDLVLAIPFNSELGYTCPSCLSVGIGAKWAQGTNYCPKCGQHIKLINVDNYDWANLLRDAEKIPDVMDSNIVTTGLDLSHGFTKAKKFINGIYLQRLKDYGDKNAQIEGQMNLMDYLKGAKSDG